MFKCDFPTATAVAVLLFGSSGGEKVQSAQSFPPPRGGYAGARRAPAMRGGGGDWALRIFHLHWNRGGALPPFLRCPVMYHEGISKGRSPISKGCLKFVCCLSPAALLKVSGSTEI